jgi:hypothetical protein
MAGQTSATVLLNAVSPKSGITLTATLGTSVPKMATVRVLGASEPPATVTMTPATPIVTAGGTVHFTVTIDIPAPPNGANVALSVNPSNAGTLPPGGAVSVTADTTTVTFDYTDGSTAPSAMITATIDSGASATATVTSGSVSTGQHLVINEVDYDQVNTDTAEFVEIYNPTASAISLATVNLVLIDGSGNKDYAHYPLAAATPDGMLAAGAYLVLTNSSSVTVAAGATRYTPTGWPTTNAIQNGNPDGLALFDTSNNTIIDALCYGGAMTAVTITGAPGTYSLVEGTALTKKDSNTAVGSIARLPNGGDTDIADHDWNFTSTPTPGSANQ